MTLATPRPVPEAAVISALRARFADFPSPSACLAPAGFDEVFKSFQIPRHPLRNDPDRIAGFFDEGLRVIFHLEHDFRASGREDMECHHPTVRRSAPAPPGNALIGNLLRNFSIPFLF